MERNERGFGVFGRGTNSHQLGEWVVFESSLAFQGAHCWIKAHTKEGERWSPHVNVAGAREIIKALQKFISEAEAGNLTEPVEPQV